MAHRPIRRPTNNTLWCGLFRNGTYVGSMNLSYPMRAVMRKNGYRTLLWEV